MSQLFTVSGAVFSLLAVVLGAFGSHGLRTRLEPRMLEIWETAVQYNFYHSLALIATGIVIFVLKQGAPANWAGWFFIAGISLFSGSLYLYSITGIKWLAMVTPFGGLCFIAGWVLFAIACFKGFRV